MRGTLPSVNPQPKETMRNGGYPTVSVRKTRRGHRNKLNLIKEVVIKKIILTNKKITNENQYIAFELWFHRFVS